MSGQSSPPLARPASTRTGNCSGISNPPTSTTSPMIMAGTPRRASGMAKRSMAEM